MLEGLLVKRIERVHRLRLVYALHLSLYATLLLLLALAGVSSQPTQTALLIAFLWLPTLAAHTAAHSLVEMRERCVMYAPAPVQSFNDRAFPVDVYDEHGNRISGDRLLPE